MQTVWERNEPPKKRTHIVHIPKDDKSVMHQLYLITAWLITHCNKGKKVLLNLAACQENFPPGNHSEITEIQLILDWAYSYTYVSHFHQIAMSAMSKIVCLWFMCERADLRVSTRAVQWNIFNFFSKYSKLNLAVTAKPDMDPFIRDLVEKPNSIDSVFITPIFMCKQGSLTHHCDSCLHHRLFWAEVTQDTVWIHPNLAAHSMPELNHLCLLCK